MKMDHMEHLNMRRFFFSAIILASVLGGCATSRILPLEGGKYKIIATSYSESGAYDKAVKEMTEYCKDRGKHLEVISENAEYTGVDKTTKAVVVTTANVIEGLSHDNGYGPHFHSLDRPDDNKVTMEFRCKCPGD